MAVVIIKADFSKVYIIIVARQIVNHRLFPTCVNTLCAENSLEFAACVKELILAVTLS